MADIKQADGFLAKPFPEALLRHGIALEQLSHGMSGLLTIGSVGDHRSSSADRKVARRTRRRESCRST